MDWRDEPVTSLMRRTFQALPLEHGLTEPPEDAVVVVQNGIAVATLEPQPVAAHLGGTDAPVDRAVNQPLLACQHDDRLLHAVILLDRHPNRTLVVRDRRGRPVGLLDTTDLLRHLYAPPDPTRGAADVAAEENTPEGDGLKEEREAEEPKGSEVRLEPLGMPRRVGVSGAANGAERWELEYLERAERGRSRLELWGVRLAHGVERARAVEVLAEMEPPDRLVSPQELRDRLEARAHAHPLAPQTSPALREVERAIGAGVEPLVAVQLAARALAVPAVCLAMARALEQPKGASPDDLAHLARVALVATLGSPALVGPSGALPRGIDWSTFLGRRPPVYPGAPVERPVHFDDAFGAYLREVRELVERAWQQPREKLRAAFAWEKPGNATSGDDWHDLLEEIVLRASALFFDEERTQRDDLPEHRVEQAQRWAALMQGVRRDLEGARGPLAEALTPREGRPTLAGFGALVILAGLDEEEKDRTGGSERSVWGLLGGLFGRK